MAKRSSKRFRPHENIFAFVSSSNKTVIPVRLDNSIFLPLGELRAFPPTITQVLQSTTNAHATVEMDLIKTIFKDTGTMSIFQRDRTFQQPVNWTTTFFMLAFHVGAVAALFTFSWRNLAVAIFLWWLTGSVGIGMCYHRLLTHRGYKTLRWLEYSMAICGTMALEGGPIAWVATHRIHHQNTDKEGDPHSPNDGGLWAHMGWIITGKAMHQNTAELLPYVPDLRKQKFYMLVSKYHWMPLAGLGGILYLFGGWSCVLWGVFLRTVVGLHATWLVNSATHMWGSRRFLTEDTSTNSFWVAILTFGEGWHNNHHAAPQAAKHGLTWYEIDVNWYGISALKALGLAWDIKMPKMPKRQPASKPTKPLAPSIATVPLVEEEILVTTSVGD
jgi:sn-1 stearoyl-lipid 9-desaturase